MTPIVELISWTGSLRPAYVAARTCYAKSKDMPLEVSDEAMYDFILEKIIGPGHLGILEHISFTFRLSGISRSLSHQLVRHRLASYAQRSQRYVSELDNLAFVLPDAICRRADLHVKVSGLLDKVAQCYESLLIEGISPEDARCILPNATETVIIMTLNARSLLEMSQKRLCVKAQQEIRKLFVQIRVLLKDVCPIIAQQMRCAQCKEKVCETV
jgi:thymidylate synthase (FAD)